MDDALVVQLELIGFAQGIRQIQQLSQAVKGIPNPIGAANAQVQQHAQRVQQASGPWQRLINSVNRYNQALKSGNQVAIFDAYSNMQRAGTSYNRARNQAIPASGIDKLSSALKTAVLSSRFGMGQGGLSVMPLVGRALQALEAAGPIGIAATVAVGALGAMAAAAHEAATRLNEFSQTRMATGGTVRETAAARTIAENFGIDPGQVGQAAKAFAGQMASPEAMAVMPQLANPMGAGPFGEADQMRLFLQGLDKLRYASDDEARQMVRAAEALEPFMRIRNMSEQNYQAMKKEAEWRAAMFGPMAQREAQQYTDRLGQVSRMMGDLKDFIGGIFMMGLNSFINWLVGIPKWFMEQLFGPLPKQKSEDQHAKALREHSRAMQEHTKAMQALPGVYGAGSERARQAVPGAYWGAWSNPDAQRALRQTVNLGAFEI